MKTIHHAVVFGAMVLAASLATSANADILYESTVINANGGGLNATTWPTLNDGLVLVDDISVPSGGWTIDTVSNFFAPLGADTVTDAYLVVFPKSLGEINPMDYATLVPVTVENEMFVDPENGFDRNTYRIDASGLNLTLASGDYWIGLSPIAADYSQSWMAWGSRTANGDRPIWYDRWAGGWVPLYAFWSGPDQMLRIQGVPEPATLALTMIPLLTLIRRRHAR